MDFQKGDQGSIANGIHCLVLRAQVKAKVHVHRSADSVQSLNCTEPNLPDQSHYLAID